MEQPQMEQQAKSMGKERKLCYQTYLTMLLFFSSEGCWPVDSIMKKTLLVTVGLKGKTNNFIFKESFFVILVNLLVSSCTELEWTFLLVGMNKSWKVEGALWGKNV